MSAVIKSRTAFLEKSLLLEALKELEVEYREEAGNQIVTHRADYYGNQKFGLDNGRYVFFFDSTSNKPNYPYRKENWGKWPTTGAFLDELERTYNRLFDERQAELERLRKEEELLRIEAERKRYVEAKKQEVIKKAKEKGYSVKEKQAGNKVKLVLVRHTY